MQREKRILGYNGTVLEFISLSTCLVMTWGSLRFSVVQCRDIKKIIYQAETMRGVLSRSKTAVSVIPLALAEEGFISRLPQLVAAVFNCFRPCIGEVRVTRS